ncbi:MAG: DUF2157 domain-containing protein [Rhizobiaceae bacterium]|nr:DUF2157 domain-containing protein [Rhizobiaceae bacterium]
MQLGYFSRLKTDSQRWIEKGIIDADAAKAILSEVESQKRGYSFTSVVIMLGVVCLAFAAMTFVAANWDAMPKFLRVLLLLVSMWLAYGAAIVANRRNSVAIADFLVMLGSAIFGATIMLVGQIYHLQGSTQDAVLLWACGALLAALLLRSNSSLWLAIALFTLWFWLGLNFNLFGSNKNEINLLYLAFWAMCGGAAYWLEARKSAHLLMLGILFWLTITLMIYSERYETIAYFLGAYAAFYLCIALAIFSLEKWNSMREFEAPFIAYMVMCIIALTSIWVGILTFGDASDIERMFNTSNQIPVAICLVLTLVVFLYGWNQKMHGVYDVGFCGFWIAVWMLATSFYGAQIPFINEAASLGLSIWLIRMGERQDIASVVRLGYLAFAMVMLLIYFRTAGTLLGTTAFYLISGILLVLGAIFIPRIFRLLRGNKEASA